MGTLDALEGRQRQADHGNQVAVPLGLHLERNRVDKDTSAAQPEQARTSEQSGNNQHDVADEQCGINGACNYAQN